MDWIRELEEERIKTLIRRVHKHGIKDAGQRGWGRKDLESGQASVYMRERLCSGLHQCIRRKTSNASLFRQTMQRRNIGGNLPAGRINLCKNTAIRIEYVILNALAI